MRQHHKYQRALMLGPVAIVAVAAAVATPLVLAQPDASSKATASRPIHTLSTAQNSAIERAVAQRSAAAASVSRSLQRAALLSKVKAAKAKRAAQVRAAKALARRKAKARKQLRLQHIKAAALLVRQRQAQAQQQLHIRQVQAEVLLYQRQVREWTAHRAAAHRAAAHRAAARRAAAHRASLKAAQKARARRSAAKRTFNAARLGSPKAYAQSLIGSGSQYGCLVLLWTRESGWNYRANNASSGAYGIPQSLPGSKMASAGADWRTNPATQIRWGLGYIRARYGTPCGAWSHSQAVGWY